MNQPELTVPSVMPVMTEDSSPTHITATIEGHVARYLGETESGNVIILLAIFRGFEYLPIYLPKTLAKEIQSVAKENGLNTKPMSSRILIQGKVIVTPYGSDTIRPAVALNFNEVTILYYKDPFDVRPTGDPVKDEEWDDKITQAIKAEKVPILWGARFLEKKRTEVKGNLANFVDLANPRIKFAGGAPKSVVVYRHCLLYALDIVTSMQNISGTQMTPSGRLHMIRSLATTMFINMKG